MNVKKSRGPGQSLKSRKQYKSPVDVIVPFEVVAGSGDPTNVFELLLIPEFVEDEDKEDEPNPLLATRLFALAEILLLRSSRNNDFNGDT